MKMTNEIIEAIELHFVEGIRSCFKSRVSPNDSFNGEPLIYELTSEYTRSPRFKDCVQAFVDFGLEFEDKALLAVLLDDAATLEGILKKKPETVTSKYSLRCAYTQMVEVRLLHICAEFNHVNCANILVQNGGDVNVVSGVDENGFGGQTPIFHTVNQNNNQSSDMMKFLLEHSADLSVTVKGIVWGKGYPWETFIPAVNPISYAMMGLLPQMHRSEQVISETVSTLIKHEFGIQYNPGNVPNKYLNA
jgi:hypothetical protein